MNSTRIRIMMRLMKTVALKAYGMRQTFKVDFPIPVGIKNGNNTLHQWVLEDKKL